MPKLRKDDYSKDDFLSGGGNENGLPILCAYPVAIHAKQKKYLDKQNRMVGASGWPCCAVRDGPFVLALRSEV
jgi:hypothetical protein